MLMMHYRHVDSAQAYRNEAAVGKAVAMSGIPREKLFISRSPLPHCLILSKLLLTYLRFRLATKIISKNHGYQKTLDGVKLSLEKFNLGTRSQ